MRAAYSATATPGPHASVEPPRSSIDRSRSALGSPAGIAARPTWLDTRWTRPTFPRTCSARGWTQLLESVAHGSLPRDDCNPARRQVLQSARLPELLRWTGFGRDLDRTDTRARRAIRGSRHTGCDGYADCFSRSRRARS